jgi:hypothetical protein
LGNTNDSHRKSAKVDLDAAARLELLWEGGAEGSVNILLPLKPIEKGQGKPASKLGECTMNLEFLQTL